MFTTVNNSALGLSNSISTLLLSIWDVSKETMLSNELSGMIKLTILTSSLQVSGLFFVKLLPKRKEDLIEMQKDPYSGSRIGGFIFLAITLFSVFSAIVISLLNIVSQGWLGESR